MQVQNVVSIRLNLPNNQHSDIHDCDLSLNESLSADSIQISIDKAFNSETISQNGHDSLQFMKKLKKILVVDDEPYNIMGLTYIINNAIK